MKGGNPILICQDVSKSFPGVRSLDRVSFEVRPGEIHALVGENGAGKSTLVRVISGALLPDGGVIRYNGGAPSWGSPKAARDAGIHVVHQELMLFPELTVAENIFCGAEPRNAFGLVSLSSMRRQAATILADLGVTLDVNTRVEALPVADQQMIEIAKALVGNVRLLILDEPTAVISGREAELLFGRLRRLRDQGVGIVYISHRLEEIFDLSDRVTVLKDGIRVGSHETARLDRRKLIRMMVGRELTDLFPARPPVSSSGELLLDVRNVSDGQRVRNFSIVVHRGEIVGLAGMVGAGRTEAAHLIFGAQRMTSGSVHIRGKDIGQPTPRNSIARGIGLLTENRKAEGLLMQLGIGANITAPRLHDIYRNGLLDLKAEAELARREIEKFSIPARRPDSIVLNLSGGNQQKVLLSRWLRICDQLLILDEPTRGVDVGAKAEIYNIIRKAANEGRGILIISSELPELIGMCERVVVMRHGIVTGELTGVDLTEEAILDLATYAA